MIKCARQRTESTAWSTCMSAFFDIRSGLGVGRFDNTYGSEDSKPPSPCTHSSGCSHLCFWLPRTWGIRDIISWLKNCTQVLQSTCLQVFVKSPWCSQHQGDLGDGTGWDGTCGECCWSTPGLASNPSICCAKRQQEDPVLFLAPFLILYLKNSIRIISPFKTCSWGLLTCPHGDALGTKMVYA